MEVGCPLQPFRRRRAVTYRVGHRHGRHSCCYDVITILWQHYWAHGLRRRGDVFWYLVWDVMGLIMRVGGCTLWALNLIHMPFISFQFRVYCSLDLRLAFEMFAVALKLAIHRLALIFLKLGHTKLGHSQVIGSNLVIWFNAGRHKF